MTVSFHQLSNCDLFLNQTPKMTAGFLDAGKYADGNRAGVLVVDWKVAHSGTDEFKLLFGGLKELESVLETLTISDFRADHQWVGSVGHLELHVYLFPQAYISSYSRAHPAFAQVLGAAMKGCSLVFDHQPEINQMSFKPAGGGAGS